MTPDTLPKLLWRNAETLSNKVALREKILGVWQESSWTAFRELVETSSQGLASLGFERGDKLAIIGDNRAHWLAAQLAAQALGGVAVGIYQDAGVKEVAYIIDHCDAKFALVEDQEQVDKVLEVLPQLPNIRNVIYCDAKGMRNYRDSVLLSFEHVQERGRKFAEKQPDWVQREVERGRGDDPAIICYTSGTSSYPKGAVLTHANMITTASAFLEVDPMYPGDDLVSHLPLPWIGEQLSVTCFLLVGMRMNFPEEPETVHENIREVGPQVFLGSARIWENLVSALQVRIAESSSLKRRLCDYFLRVGSRMVDARRSDQAPGWWLRILYRAGGLLVYEPIKDHLGLGRVRHAYTSGAPLGADVFRFFHALGVNLKQVYGLTETCGVLAMHRDGDVHFQTAGIPIPGMEIRLSEAGEIVSRGHGVFNGYYRNPEATAATLRDGWLHSCDAGTIDDRGHLTVIDRLSDVMTLRDGRQFSSQNLENKLKFSPYVREAVVVGHERSYVIALINIDLPNVRKWADGRQVSYTTYADLAQKPEVYSLILSEVGKVNAELAEVAQIQKFLLLHKELDPDDEELTRTRKVRRKFVEQRYERLIDALYGDADHVVVATDVKYRDGREVRIEARLRIAAAGLQRERDRMGVG